MLVRPINLEEKSTYNSIVTHPLQSWEWGEFKRLSGQRVERIGIFDGSKLLNAIQVTFTKTALGRTLGYLPKGPMPDEEQLAALKQIAHKSSAIYIKLEPNIMNKVGSRNSGFKAIDDFIKKRGGRKAQPFFSPYTFLLDLSVSQDAAFARLDSQTRYNIRLAIKNEVQIIDDSSDDGIETFIKLLDETAPNQNFYTHDATYYRHLWQTVGKSGIMKIFHAVYKDTVLVSWIIFVFNGRLYYPYGASSVLHREVMAANLLLWEVIKFGIDIGAHSFDLWGALGEKPNPRDPWYGFHKFKQGYGGQLIENFTTFDLVYDPVAYQLINFSQNWRLALRRGQNLLGLPVKKGDYGIQI